MNGRLTCCSYGCIPGKSCLHQLSFYVCVQFVCVCINSVFSKVHVCSVCVRREGFSAWQNSPKFLSSLENTFYVTLALEKNLRIFLLIVCIGLKALGGSKRCFCLLETASRELHNRLFALGVTGCPDASSTCRFKTGTRLLSTNPSTCLYFCLMPTSQ